ncbi:hypothetical protein KQI52_15680 [bacterium]|nr:hypothetical protein [bacterium]
MTRRLGGLIAIMLLLASSSLLLAQDEEVKPKEVHSVKVADAEVIETFRRGQLISPTIAIDSVEFIDVTRNGFGQGDLMIVYPQERVFPLLEINETERSILNLYEFEENKTYSAPTLNVTQIQEDARVLESPFAGILATVVKGVQYYYTGNYIQGLFRITKDRDVATLTLWNYAEEDMRYSAGSPSGIADTLLNYDLLKVYIRELTTDTVYVPVLVSQEDMESPVFPGVGIPLDAATNGATTIAPDTTMTPDAATTEPGTGEAVAQPDQTDGAEAETTPAENETPDPAGAAAGVDTTNTEPEPGGGDPAQ